MEFSCVITNFPPLSVPSPMLSQEFIPTSSSDGDFAPTTNTITNFNTNMNFSSISTTVTATASKSVNYSTNPEGIKFVPQPPVQFYYSLQKNSLRTVIDTLLSATELAHLCTVFKVPCYGRWLKKKKMIADLLVDFMLNLKQAYARDQFNEIVDKINELKGRDMLGRIPKLPEKIDPIKVLKGSISLGKRIIRPNFPVRLDSKLKEITGLIFLDETNVPFFTLDLFFTISSKIVAESNNSNVRFILSIYQSSERIKDGGGDLHTYKLNSVSPSLLDLTLNGSVLEQGNCRFRNHDSFDITLFCYKDRANLLRIIRHETHVNLNHLVLEIAAINLASSLSETRPSNVNFHNPNVLKRPREQEQLEAANETIKGKYLKEDLVIEEITFAESLSRLQQSSENINPDEVELLENSLRFSLKCPISFTRIRQPVKFRSCRHGQCFDLSNWKEITRNLLNFRLASVGKSLKYPTKISCPICGLIVEDTSNEQEQLVIDGMFKKFLQSAGAEDVSVELNLKDGTFTFQEESDDSASDSEERVDESINDGHNERSVSPIKAVSASEIISIVTDSEDEDEDIRKMLTYKGDKSRPIGSCPSRAITID